MDQFQATELSSLCPPMAPSLPGCLWCQDSDPDLVTDLTSHWDILSPWLVPRGCLLLTPESTCRHPPHPGHSAQQPGVRCGGQGPRRQLGPTPTVLERTGSGSEAHVPGVCAYGCLSWHRL